MQILSLCCWAPLAVSIHALSAQDQCIDAACVSTSVNELLLSRHRQLIQKSVRQGTLQEATVESDPIVDHEAAKAAAWSRSVENSTLPLGTSVANTAGASVLQDRAAANITGAKFRLIVSDASVINVIAVEMVQEIKAWLLKYDMPMMLWAYLALAFFNALVIVCLYWKCGWNIITRLLIYLAALSTMKLVVKSIYVTYHWEFPKLVTATHFLSGSIAAFGYLFYQSQAEGKKIHVPTAWEFWALVLPISIGFAISVVASNMALYFCSAAFTEIIGATSPVFSAMVGCAIGLPFHSYQLGPLILVVFGGMISTSGELDFSGIGLVFCLVGCIARAVKATLQQKAMNGELKQKYDPVTLMAWMCVPSFIFMMACSLAAEGLEPYRQLRDSSQRNGILGSVALSCLNATILNLSNLFCTRDLGAVGVQLVAQMKGVLTVLGAVALFNESVALIQIFGYAAVLCGVALYSRYDEKSSADEKAEASEEAKRAASELLENSNAT